MSASPWALVAVATRPPAAAAPMQALIALCSLSTRIVSVSTLPFDTNDVNDSMMPVDGVMGYAGITSGFNWRSASATAWFPVTATVFVVVTPMLFALLFHDDGLVPFFAGALHGADTATFAVVVIELCPFFVLGHDGGIGTVDPAKQALDAVLLDPARLERSPRSGLIFIRIAGLQHRACMRQLFPVHLFHPSFTSSYPRFTAARFPSMIFCANFFPKLPFTSSSSTCMGTMLVALFTAPSMHEFGMGLPTVSTAILDASTVKTFWVGLA